MTSPNGVCTVRNEFAAVQVEVVDHGFRQGVVLRLPETGQRLRLDPLELEALVVGDHPALGQSIRAMVEGATADNSERGSDERPDVGNSQENYT